MTLRSQIIFKDVAAVTVILTIARGRPGLTTEMRRKQTQRSDKLNIGS